MVSRRLPRDQENWRTPMANCVVGACRGAAMRGDGVPAAALLPSRDMPVAAAAPRPSKVRRRIDMGDSLSW
ncbi:hypothetical protein TPA0910_12760 [Streptomyces hygroscopicus subsp. sporocinereus]|uniref:Uncharacterized protein n=1 Tax=Streptomyces hygroscopicus TaxID=1912 RepID=A0ABQ3TV64_STRHY|nr:hypothetical protein TPA0910_12760 [Streptomyces hygroscopicus]